jgi:hypothetical protein
MPSQSDRVFYGVMLAAASVVRFTGDDVYRVLGETLDDDELPAKKTVYNRVGGLEEVDVLTVSETPGRTRRTHYTLNPIFADEI